MAASRASSTLLTSFRSTIPASTATPWSLSTHCLRLAHRQKRLQLVPRRYQATASAAAHRVQDLPTQATPPPRNAGIPETSIAGGQPQIDDLQLPEHISSQQGAAAQNSDISITEAEAQKTRPPSGPDSTLGSVASTPAPTSTPPARPTRKSKLRARKAAMTLTSTAVEQLRDLLNSPTPKLIRVGVKNRGCSGLAYHLEYVEKPGTFDESVEQDGVKVLIDSKALFSIIGSEMDWAEDKLSRRFVFRNPNISTFKLEDADHRKRVLTMYQLSSAGAESRSLLAEDSLYTYSGLDGMEP